jgi:hypothetical protein
LWKGNGDGIFVPDKINKLNQKTTTGNSRFWILDLRGCDYMANYKTIGGYGQEPAFSGDVRSPENGDLKVLNNKVLFVRNDGSYCVINNDQLRMNRINSKLNAWERVIRSKGDYIDTRAYQIGLSYRPGETWKQKDISDYLENVMEYATREKVVGYSWVAEMQKRGEVHYHAEIITTKACRKIPMPDKKGHWRKGSSSRREVSYVEINYLTSEYMRKKEQKSNYPKGIRIHSTWLNKLYFDAVDFWALRSAGYPNWLVSNINNEGLVNPKITHAKGGGWLVKCGAVEYFWKNNDGYILTGRKALDFLELEKYKYPIPF